MKKKEGIPGIGPERFRTLQEMVSGLHEDTKSNNINIGNKIAKIISDTESDIAVLDVNIYEPDEAKELYRQLNRGEIHPDSLKEKFDTFLRRTNLGENSEYIKKYVRDKFLEVQEISKDYKSQQIGR
jgi:hypothetical protein